MHLEENILPTWMAPVWSLTIINVEGRYKSHQNCECAISNEILCFHWMNWKDKKGGRKIQFLSIYLTWMSKPEYIDGRFIVLVNNTCSIHVTTRVVYTCTTSPTSATISYLHQRPENWRQVQQVVPIFLTKQPDGNQLTLTRQPSVSPHWLVTAAPGTNLRLSPREVCGHSGR